MSPFNSLCGFGIHGGPAEVLCRSPKAHARPVRFSTAHHSTLGLCFHWDRHAYKALTLNNPLDRPRPEVHPPPLYGTVHLLRLRQRVPERRPHALRHRPVDLAERQHRLRVHVVHLVASAGLVLPHPIFPATELYVCTDSQMFFVWIAYMTTIVQC